MIVAASRIRSAKCLRMFIEVPIELNNTRVSRAALSRKLEAERTHEIDETAGGQAGVHDEL